MLDCERGDLVFKGLNPLKVERERETNGTYQADDLVRPFSYMEDIQVLSSAH
jgi:hypothetical protein